MSGQADDMEAFSRQIATFEKNEYIQNIGTLNSTLGASAKADFNLSLALDPKIFNYIANNQPSLVTTASAGLESPLQAGNNGVLPAQANQKFITFFSLPLNPEVDGQIDETKYTIAINVPYGTDVTKISPLIVASPGAVVSPSSGISQNFKAPVTYTVTAQDGSAQNYSVTVTVLPKGGVQKQSGQSGLGIIFSIIIVILVITALVAGAWLFMRNKKIKSAQI